MSMYRNANKTALKVKSPPLDRASPDLNLTNLNLNLTLYKLTANLNAALAPLSSLLCPLFLSTEAVKEPVLPRKRYALFRYSTSIESLSTRSRFIRRSVFQSLLVCLFSFPLFFFLGLFLVI